MNNVSLLGRIATDLEIKRTQNNKSYVSFSLAVDRFSNGNKTADFIRCTAWGKNAENIMKFFSKGSTIAVNGSIQTGAYTDRNGTKHYTTGVAVSNFYFMAKSVLAWDEIEDLGYIFFEEGYIDRYSPSDRAMYGNGVDEKDIYALADKMRNGEDVRADLTRALLGNQQTFTTKQDNTFHVTYNKDDITAAFGNAEKSISYEAVGDAFLKFFEDEYKEIMAARESERLAEERMKLL